MYLIFILSSFFSEMMDIKHYLNVLYILFLMYTTLVCFNQIYLKMFINTLNQCFPKWFYTT